MSAILQVIGRELRVRALMPATGAATAVAILLAGWLVAGGDRFTEVAETSIYFASFFLAGGGLLTGSLVVARDLEGNRSLFWLARPIGVWTAFGGKLVAALILVISTTLLVALPAIVVDPSLLASRDFSSAMIGVAILCVALGASLGLLLGNRSAWFLAAAAILIAFGAGVWLNVEEFFGDSYGMAVIGLLIFVAVVALTLALVSGHGIAFSRERHDARRQARTFTLVLAVILGVVLVLSWMLTAWLKSLDIEDFDAVFVSGSAGNVVVVKGYRDAKPIRWSRSFLVDLQKGTSVPLPPGTSRMALTPSGAFYAVPTNVSGTRHEVFAIDLEPGARATATGIVVDQHLFRLATLDDGSRLAVATPDGTQVFDSAGKSLGSFISATRDEGKRGGPSRPVFLDRDRLRLYENVNLGSTLIRDVDLRSRSIRDAGTLPGRVYGIAPGNENVIVMGQQGDDLATTPVLSFHDATSGARIYDFPPNSWGAIPLTDGTWATLVRGDTSRLVRLDRAGKVVSSVPFTERQVVIGSEVRPGIVWFSERLEESSPENRLRDVILIESTSGKVIKRIPKATHASFFGHESMLPAPGSSEARLISKEGVPHLINRDTLEPERVVPK